MEIQNTQGSTPIEHSTYYYGLKSTAKGIEYMKTIKTLICVGILLQLFCINCFLPKLSYSCWGGRPLAMGGAFTGVADTVDAIYWNPAGLAQIESSSFNSTFVTNWHDSNYDIYFATAGPLRYGSFGLAYVYNKDYYYIEKLEFGRLVQKWYYLQFSYGSYLLKDWNLALGISAKSIWSKFVIEVNDEYAAYGDESLDNDNVFDLDIGIHWAFGPEIGKYRRRRYKSNRYKMFSLGCLFQNVGESEFHFKTLGLTIKHLLNVRPGFCFRPDDMTIFSLEIYDATREYFNKPQIRMGFERWLSFGKKMSWKRKKKMALRAGGYHLNEKEIKAYTIGVGWEFDNGAEFAYTLLFWDIDNEKSHLLSLNIKF
jgi:hypothetical protein